MKFVKTTRCLGLGLMIGWVAPIAWAQIYTCTDASGRKLTSDRPIAECLSKDQKELNPSGTVKRVVKPVMTADEQRVADQKAKEEAEEKARAEEERRKNRALLSRYPNKAAHDKERMDALAQVDEVIKAAQKRIGELAEQRKKINEELEFYKKDPSKLPPALKRQLEDNERSVVVQRRFIGDQDDEKRRANARFDEELDRLRKLWAQAALPATNAAAAPAPASSPAKK
jgi:chromosome segregation ATPase